MTEAKSAVKSEQQSQPKQPKTRTFTAEEVGLVNNPTQHKPTVRTDLLTVPHSGKLQYEVISDGTITLDHASAARYIDLPVFPGERKAGNEQVQLLYDEMRRGTFNELLVILSTAVLEGVEYKINGQHTCWAVQCMPASFSLRVREIKYRVHNQTQLKMLYRTYDRAKARTDAHLTKVQLAGTPVMEGLNISLVGKISGGLKFWYFDEPHDRGRVTPEQVAAIVQNQLFELWRRVALCVQTHAVEHKHIARSPVIGAMFATFEKVPTKAEEFWGPVATGLGLTNKTDPRLKLRDLLMQSTTRVSLGAKDYLAPEAVYRMCILAWNHWRKHSPVKVLRTSKERPDPA